MMSEESIFAAALQKSDPAERAAYLDEACAGDAPLRQRVEALLQSHFAAGSFLGTPAVCGAVEKLEGLAGGGETRTEPPGDDGGGDSLDFLAPSAKPGTIGRLGHYEVLEVIGRGGMGIVLRAFDEKLHRVVAIKVMAAQLATNAIARKRFTREAQAAAAVSHDHIVTIHAVEEANGLPYLVMQCVSGMSLQERLDRDGPLQLTEIVRIGMQTAAGLAAAHAQGLIHRDIKPANILLENGVERVKITDFGLARVAADASLTQSGVVAGTPQYMAPEQARGAAIDQRADLFSLGSVLYAMCTGRPPFRAAETMAVLKRVCEETPTPIRETNPEIPDWLVAIIARLQAKHPAQRFASAAVVAELLGQHLAHLQHPSVAPLPAPADVAAAEPAKPRPRHRRWAIAAMLLLLALGSLALLEATGVIRLRATVSGIFAPEGAPVPGPKAAIAERGAFVVLGGPGVAEKKFDTLAEAVAGACDCDTIEVRGNGPFASEPVKIRDRALTIRAAAGFRPVIKLSEEGLAADASFLSTNGPLALEGLELQRTRPKRTKESDEQWQSLVVSSGRQPLYLANCRLVLWPVHTAVRTDSSHCEFRNCEVLFGPSASPVIFDAPPRGRLVLHNCILAAGAPIVPFASAESNVSVQLSRNTIVGKTCCLWLSVHQWHQLGEGQQGKLCRVNASGNIFDRTTFDRRSCVLLFNQKVADPLPIADLEKLLPRAVLWDGDANLYNAEDRRLLQFYVDGSPVGEPTTPLRSLADWKRFWGAEEAGSLEGRARLSGGDLYSRLEKEPERLTPEDFRLRPDSPGYRAGKDGKDLGADLDLVGPGPAYDRWKKTPEYQQWLKDTGQSNRGQP